MTALERMTEEQREEVFELVRPCLGTPAEVPTAVQVMVHMLQDLKIAPNDAGEAVIALFQGARRGPTQHV